MEEKLDSARHRDATTKRGSKVPVAGGIKRRTVEGRSHAVGQHHPRDISLHIHLDVDRHIAAHTCDLCRVRGLLPFLDLRRLDLRRLNLRSGWRARILRLGDGLQRKPSAESDQQAAIARCREKAKQNMGAE